MVYSLDESGSASDAFDLLTRNRPDWFEEAACRRARSEISWFPDRRADAVPALRICAECKVRETCREWALSQDPNLDGIWGGTTRAERDRIRGIRR